MGHFGHYGGIFGHDVFWRLQCTSMALAGGYGGGRDVGAPFHPQVVKL